MTESSPGPGWWLASDGNWYPPHLHPDVRAREAAAAAAASAAAATTRPGDEHLGRAVVADTVARAAATDAEIMQAFRTSTPAADPTTAMPHVTDADRTIAFERPVADAAGSSSIEHIVASSGGGIDWEAVARERAAQREARNQQSSATRRKVVVGIGAGVVALLAIFLVTRGGDDDPSTGLTTAGSTTLATVPATTATPATTAARATTAAPATTTAATSSTVAGSTTKAPTSTAAPSTTAAGAGTNVSVFSLAPGSCIDQENLTTGLVTTVRTVPCEQPHTHEVYLKTTVTPADATYDAAKVTAFANQACSDGFKTYVGIAYDQSKYYFLHLAPSAESWNKNKDRDVVCLLLLEGQRLTGSVKGKGE